jgi:hypothetical protein
VLLPPPQIEFPQCKYFSEGEYMADLDAVLEQLKQERRRAEGELKQLEKVITALSRMGSRPFGPAQVTKRRLSAAARERIAAAQRARWAKVRAQSKKTFIKSDDEE